MEQQRPEMQVRAWCAPLSDYASTHDRNEDIAANHFWSGRLHDNVIHIKGAAQGDPLDSGTKDPREAFEILAHESRHAFQDKLIMEHREAYADNREPNLCGVSRTKVQEWLYAGPVPHPVEDPVGYRNHPREVDARLYAHEFVRRMCEVK